MKTIEYKIVYTGRMTFSDGRVSAQSFPEEEIARVQARDINAGFGKALKKAKEPLGNGIRREIASVAFWAVV
jgi:hypothetical protein